MPNLGGWELVILIGVLVLLFGAKRLPDMARSIGQSARVFKGEMKGMKGDDEPAPTPADEPATTAQPTALPPTRPIQQTAPPATAPDAQEATRVTQPGSGQPGQ